MIMMPKHLNAEQRRILNDTLRMCYAFSAFIVGLVSFAICKRYGII